MLSFYTATNKPIGLVQHLLKNILLKGGMFNSSAREGGHVQDRFEEILDAVWWTGSVSRPPKKVNVSLVYSITH